MTIFSRMHRRLSLALAALLFGGAGAAAIAQTKFVPINPLDWSVTDGTAKAADKTSAITLSPGAQLYRHFEVGRIDLHVSSQPVFGTAAADWQTIDLGPASLTFVRDSKGGGLVLLGDEPLSLPFALELDEKGRAAKPLDLKLSYDQGGAVALLTVQGVNFDVSATAASGPIEVALSAGRSAPWTLDIFEIRLPQIDLTSPVTKTTTAAAPTAAVWTAEEFTRRHTESRTLARSLFLKDQDLAGESALTEANANPRGSPEWCLESANKLIQEAFSLTRSGRPAKAAQLARRALEHCDKASRKAARQPELAPLVAAADETAAMIQERLLADVGAAKAFYESSALRAPNGQGANELKRLKQVDRELRRKAGETVPEPAPEDLPAFVPANAPVAADDAS